MPTRRKLDLILMSLFAVGFTAQARGAVDTWIGGNTSWVDGSGATNWNPNDEPDTNDTANFNTNNSVTLGSNNAIQSLTMSSSIELNLSAFDLTVSGGVTTLTGAGTTLVIPTSSSFNAENITLTTSAQLHLEGGQVVYSDAAGVAVISIGAGTTLIGQGLIFNGDGPLAVSSVIVNEGAISAGLTGIFIGAPAAGTLSLTASSGLSRIDLDGVSGAGIVNVFRNQTLDINITVLDAFDGTINMYQNSSLDIAGPWTLLSGTMEINNGFQLGAIPSLNVPAGVAYIKGGAFTQTSGSINVVDYDGTLQFDAPFTMNGGSLTNNGLIVFNNDATISATASFTMPNSASSFTVNPGVNVTINQTDFNADGGGFSTNIITVESSGVLALNIGTGGDSGLTGVVNLNGGSLVLTNSAANWSMNGNLNTGAGTGFSTVGGDDLALQGSVSVAAGSTLTFNSGVIFQGGTYTGAGMLRINSISNTTASTTISVTTFDLDGIGTGTHHAIYDGAILTINSANFDTDGDMDDPLDLLGAGAQFIVNGPTQWTMRGTVNANTSGAGTVTLGGTSRVILASLLNVDGPTLISAPVTYDGGSTASIDLGMTLIGSGAATYSGGSISGLGEYSPPFSNTVDTSSTINVANFNFDAGNWTIDAGAQLSVSVTDYDPDVATNAFGSGITINSGSISVFTADAEFIMDGVLNLNNTTGAIPFWTGEPLDIGNDIGTGDAQINVGGTGTSQIGAPVDFNSDADVVVSAGATLAFTTAATVNFNTVNGATSATFTGAGGLSFSGVVNVNEAVTLNVGGFVDLDGSDSIGEFINIDAPLTINAAALASFGRVNGGGGTNTLDINNSVGTGILTVNFGDPAVSWTLNAPGVMNLVNDNVAATLLAGNQVNLNGTVNVTGDVRTTAQINLAGIININTAGQPFRLGGGDTSTNPNLIAGGLITGPGVLGADTTALRGYGTINSDIDFDGPSDLIAEDGTLTLNGAILDADSVGATATGVLNVVNPWDSAPVGVVLLSGGELRGGFVTVNNASGIRGAGLVTSRVINNTLLHADDSGQPLIVQTAGNDNDWDGAANTGTLAATGGAILEVRDNAGFTFNGVAFASNATVFANGFGLNFSPTSSLLLSGGTFRSTVSTDFSGPISVGAGADSTIDIQVNFFLDINPTASFTLDGNLRLVSNNAGIAAGATFAGTGALIVPVGSHLIADPNANINVLLDVRGLFRPGGFNTVGRIDLRDYQQGPNGELLVELTGTGLNQFDRLVVNGAAVLNGLLDLELDGGFFPNLGDSFNVISATGGVSGTFSTISGSTTINILAAPVINLGVVFTPTYNPTIVTITASSLFYEIQSGTYPQNFTGAGYELHKVTAGTAVLNGTSSYTGATRLFNGVVTLDSPAALGAAGPIHLGGGTLAFSATNTTDYSARFSNAAGQLYNIDTGGQTVTFATGLGSTNSVLTKLGAGTLVLSGPNTYGATAITTGTLQIGNNGVTGALGTGSVANNGTLAFRRTNNLNVTNTITGAGGITQLGTGTTTLSAYQGTGAINVQAGRLTLGGAAQPAVRTSSLTIAGTPTVPTAALDLKDGGLIITYAGDGSAETAATYQRVIAGKGVLDGNFIFDYSGNGITSSTARAENVVAFFDLYAVGVLNNTDLDAFGVNPQYNTTSRLFMGQGVASNTVLARYTYSGDINLDGQVNIDDYNYIDAAFAVGPGVFPGGWISGDFNNDGAVNIDDYNVIDAAFALQGAPLSGGGLIPAAAPQAPAGGAGGGSAAVPEPASLMLLGLSAVGMLMRRKRQIVLKNE